MRPPFKGPMNIVDIISKKKKGLKLKKEELEFLISSYVKGDIPDYQMASWLMAVYFQGLDIEETSFLTKLMKDSGETLSFEDIIAVDKHSTGGVGDKISIVLVPVLSALGVHVPMISGRGLGHTGGTLDKLESIPGFKVFKSKSAIESQVRKHRQCIVGQSENLCPADKKLYSLRDVTSTVDSIPLICASIMSKKLAEGIKGLLMDVKFGSGAFMKDPKDALSLAKQLKLIGEKNDVRTICMLTNMGQPLGSFIGNALEIKECVDILKGKSRIHKGVDLYKDVRELVIEQAAYLLILSQKEKKLDKARKKVLEVLENGMAMKEFEALCKLQGGVLPKKVSKCQFSKEIRAEKSGFISSFETEAFGLCNVALGGGRLRKEDGIDYNVGIEVKVKIGMNVKKGEVLAVLYSNDKTRLLGAEALIKKAVGISSKRTKFKLIGRII